MSKLNIDKIFVSIASYKDPEIVPTIKDGMEQAYDLNRIIFGVCLQDTDEMINEFPFKNHPNVIMANMNFREAKGVSYARRYIQDKLFKNEKYYLQIDSHTRFAKNWDKTLIEQLKSCPSKRSIISTYPNHYSRSDHNKSYLKNKTLSYIGIDYFSNDNYLMVGGKTIVDSLKRHLWIAAGFIFTYGIWVKEVPYDNRLYFRGEEDSLTIRSFTFGWDVYCPTVSTVYHCYQNNLLESKEKYRTLHWEDNKSVNNFHLLNDLYNGISKDGINIGHERSVADFQKTAGINYHKKKVKGWAKQGLLYEEYINNTNVEVKFIIINSNKIPPSKLWIFALFDKNNDEFYTDCVTDRNILENRGNIIKKWIDNYKVNKIKSILIWPKLKSDDFGERYMFNLTTPTQCDIGNKKISLTLDTVKLTASPNFKGKQKIRLNLNKIPIRNDIECLVFAMFNAKNVEVIRDDIYDSEIITRKKNLYIVNSDIISKNPVKYILWPLLKNGTFLERMEYDIEWCISDKKR